ncbi:MAG: LysM domain-containing protein [Tepidimonas sp.]|uniref:LysM peptidoglycan-binding domain-containing protein n=1 Tax=Tepidimonas sp. TaxID=2002775 RepID=UPI00298EDD44|nr:LysM domain-containing protein [Tepidimonas sp.]MCS6810536.1 LysM peptidoglycan-binding domain-containing protein [Tepidimonas sp.]MDW8335536.1 LysM domain-containing protein [Tepidimonas sp.]
MNTSQRPLKRSTVAAAAVLAAALGLGAAEQASAQGFPNYPITPQQRSTAQQVAQAGVPLAELAPDAPERYTVKRGDTLWAIAGLYLKKPWRWPELWGMNLQQIRNPHLIYPGQVLVLVRVGDRAMLQLASDEPPTVKLSPRVRAEALPDRAVPALPPGAIEPFLVDVRVVDPQAHDEAPRIVAGPERRVLLARGDRAYARGQTGPSTALAGEPLQAVGGQPRLLDVIRQAQPLKDPDTGELLGYEARRVGQATLVRSERVASDADGSTQLVPATIDIVRAWEEIRLGDRLLPVQSLPRGPYVPHAPAEPVQGRIVKVHGDAVQIAGQYQVVVLNRGREHGLENGHVLALLKESARVTDTTDPDRPALRLPGEPNGVMMVFRTFERVAYALVLQITDAVKVGDRFTNP